jgi:hypothetical protein
MHEVTFAEEQLGEIGAVLPGCSGDERYFVSHKSLAVVSLIPYRIFRTKRIQTGGSHLAELGGG